MDTANMNRSTKAHNNVQLSYISHSSLALALSVVASYGRYERLLVFVIKEKLGMYAKPLHDRAITSYCGRGPNVDIA